MQAKKQDGWKPDELPSPNCITIPNLTLYVISSKHYLIQRFFRNLILQRDSTSSHVETVDSDTLRKPTNWKIESTVLQFWEVSVYRLNMQCTCSACSYKVIGFFILDSVQFLLLCMVNVTRWVHGTDCIYSTGLQHKFIARSFGHRSWSINNSC